MSDVKTNSAGRGIVAVIGASRGIGLELVRVYAESGWRVHATTRTPDSPGALGTIEGDVVLHQLDVLDSAQIAAFAQALADEPIDHLLHNAGVHARDFDADTVMRINAEAPFAVVEPLLARVAASGERKLLLMTSQLGARRGQSAPLGTYGESKAKLNDRFRELEPSWRSRGIVSIVVHPGWVQTDMGGASAPVTPEESATGIKQVMDGLRPDQSGQFLTWTGEVHPW